MSRTTVLPGLALAAGALLGLPAAASAAPTLAFAQPCALVGAPAPAVVAGLAPGQAVQVGPNAIGAVGVVAGPDGTAAVTPTAPTSLSGRTNRQQTPFNVYATGGATPIATAALEVERPRFLLSPRVIRARNPRLQVTLIGFTSGQPAFLHAKVRGRTRTFPLGTPTGSCGQLTVRKAFLRSLKIRSTGFVTVTVDASPTPSSAARPQGGVRVLVRPPVLPRLPTYRVQVGSLTTYLGPGA